jgi:DNA-nicking Smr family endonuclease
MSRDTRAGEEPEAEAELFEQAMSDVARLEHSALVPEIVYHPPVSLSEREREALRELDGLIAGTEPFELRESDEYHEGRVPGLDPSVLKRLHQGEFTIQAELDLHGCDAASARGLVTRLIGDAHARGLRCVRIVHGRGRNSPGGEPVLKAALPHWLSRGPTRRIVLAYTSAAPRDGGAGATYVLIRGR